ncbi:MAG: NADH-quinone oxidoreductase subunit C [Acidobacteriota bacterium]
MDSDKKNNYTTADTLTIEFLAAMKDKITNVAVKPRRIYFEVREGFIREVAGHLFNKMHCRLSTATALETYECLEVIYHFSLDMAGTYYSARVLVKDKKNPQTDSISMIVKGAEWIEREMHELWGIEFKGHPRPEPLLTGNHPRGIKVPLRFKEIT